LAHFKANYNLPQDAAEDAWQEVCIRLIRSIGKFKAQDVNRINGWLLKVANNVAIDYYRKKSNFLKALSSFSNSLIMKSEEVVSEDAELMRSIIFSGLLKPVEIEILKSYYWFDQSYGNIAKDFGVSLSTLKSRIRRIEKKVQKEFLRRKGENFSNG
jgi:RNA polymerase sigma-70 factor (ECF subfamily)